jgi:integrase
MTIVKVSEFLAQYEAKNTRLAYMSTIKKYLSLKYPNLSDIDEIGVQYIQSNPDVRSDLIKFRESIQSNAPKTRLSALTAVLRFLEENEISLPKAFLKNLKGRETESISEKYVPTNADLARFVEFLPLLGRAMTLTLSSSGMRIGECLALKLEDVDFNKSPVRVLIKASTTKTKKKRLTFISSEAKVVVEEWLKYRSEWFKVQQSRSTTPMSDDGRLFPISKESFIDMWKRALIKSKLLKIDSRTNRMTMHPHSLRKYFRTRGQWTLPDAAEALLGHIQGVEGVYARYDQAEDVLIKCYLEAEQHLSVNANSKTITDLRQNLTKQDNDVQILTKNFTIKNAKLENELAELSEKYNQTIKDFPRMVEVVLQPYLESINTLWDRVNEAERG